MLTFQLFQTLMKINIKGVSSNYVKDALEELDRKFMDNKSMLTYLLMYADDTSATKHNR